MSKYSNCDNKDEQIGFTEIKDISLKNIKRLTKVPKYRIFDYIYD